MCRFWYLIFALCRYVSESGWCSVDKGGWEEEIKIECEGTRQKSKVNVPVYNFNKMRRCGMTCYFSPQPKASALGTVEDNPIDLSDEGDD